jgi:N-acetylglucosamine-6-phosphate deacetylase
MDLPGFVDLQVNGYKGVDFSSVDLTEEDFAKACRQLLSSGTSAFLPTVITSPEKVYERNLKIISEVIAGNEFKDSILGIHLEGPFISKVPGAVGAHNSEWVKKPSIQFLEQMNKWANSKIKILTVAAELPNSLELIKHATQMGISIFLGHQTADEKQLQLAALVGAKAITHLGNAMPNKVDRHDNSLTYGLAVDGLAATIVTDGHHLPLHLIKTIIKVKGIDNIAVVSDASSMAGMPPGKYESMGNRIVLEESGLLHNPQKKCMVGSSFTITECINFLIKQKILNQQQAVQVGFYNPLRLINISLHHNNLSLPHKNQIVY